MYTVFDPSGTPKAYLGMTVFVRTLAAAKSHMEPGDEVTRWSSSGGVQKCWTMSKSGKLVPWPRDDRGVPERPFDGNVRDTPGQAEAMQAVAEGKWEEA